MIFVDTLLIILEMISDVFGVSSDGFITIWFHAATAEINGQSFNWKE